jgi:hypothetical protein
MGQAGTGRARMGQVGTGWAKMGRLGTGQSGTGRSQQKLQRTFFLLTGLTMKLGRFSRKMENGLSSKF